jgi:L-alanine-DL-glutamate epimerase-like enolase superfamily enzyme
MKITAVDLAICPLALKHPIQIGSVQMKTRDYIALRISTDSGTVGFALGYRSGTALLDIAAAIAPRLLGRDPLMSREFVNDCENAMIQARATAVRALSLFEIALWDIACKTARLPLHQMLGGLRRSLPALAVAGFSYEARDHADIEDELERLIQAGLRHVKLLIKGSDARANATYLARMVRRADGRAKIVVDAHWSWRYLAEALETCLAVDDLGLGFIEDPFLPQQWRLAAELRGRLRTPIAMGEDAVDPFSLLDIVQNVDVLRIDATASGGVSAAMAALGIASAFGRQVIPHVFPYLHLHLACAHPTVQSVEYIPNDTDADPIRSLLEVFPEQRDGDFNVSDEPGNGIMLNWAAVGRHATAHRSVGA